MAPAAHKASVGTIQRPSAGTSLETTIPPKAPLLLSEKGTVGQFPQRFQAAPVQLDQTSCTSTTPGTALMAPAICGETLNRPGNFTSTSVAGSSSSTMLTSPSTRSRGGGAERGSWIGSKRRETPSIGASPRRNTRRLFGSLAVA